MEHGLAQQQPKTWSPLSATGQRQLLVMHIVKTVAPDRVQEQLGAVHPGSEQLACEICGDGALSDTND
ncbi:hypothetical protein GN244_ATG08187 [Phytophthora infestans]|uniref:Uncharacterized protein n=1 Tax=Phytophthora infestans TaxID=4787 RepID=A0A833WEY0_PHYIN|nr:hypothetical protein GN244_ATG08187 [Phytophthora infestans]KAF4143826.1 hypothetical protein GN958_ATG06912 [Phytophthora infestans]